MTRVDAFILTDRYKQRLDRLLEAFERGGGRGVFDGRVSSSPARAHAGDEPERWAIITARALILGEAPYEQMWLYQGHEVIYDPRAQETDPVEYEVLDGGWASGEDRRTWIINTFEQISPADWEMASAGDPSVTHNGRVHVKAQGFIRRLPLPIGSVVPLALITRDAFITAETFIINPTEAFCDTGEEAETTTTTPGETTTTGPGTTTPPATTTTPAGTTTPAPTTTTGDGLGACCLPPAPGDCQQMTMEACLASGGIFLGEGTPCIGGICAGLTWEPPPTTTTNIFTV